MVAGNMYSSLLYRRYYSSAENLIDGKFSQVLHCLYCNYYRGGGRISRTIVFPDMICRLWLASILRQVCLKQITLETSGDFFNQCLKFHV